MPHTRYKRGLVILACFCGGALLLLSKTPDITLSPAQANGNNTGHSMARQPTATAPADIAAQKNALSQQHSPPPISPLGHGTRFSPDITPQPGERIEVFVELSAASIAELYVQANAEGESVRVTLRAISQTHLQHIDAAQQALIEALTGPAIDADILGRVRYVLNGIAIRVEASKLPQIHELPGVAAVWPLHIGRYDTQPASPAAAPGEMHVPDNAIRPGNETAPGYPVEVPALE